MEKKNENTGQELKPPRKKKYQNRRKINTNQLKEGSIRKYDLETSLEELKRMFDELLLKFTNHIVLTRREGKNTTTYSGFLRVLRRIRGKLN
jgi:hypothetical protein